MEHTEVEPSFCDVTRSFGFRCSRSRPLWRGVFQAPRPTEHGRSMRRKTGGVELAGWRDLQISPYGFRMSGEKFRPAGSLTIPHRERERERPESRRPRGCDSDLPRILPVLGIDFGFIDPSTHPPYARCLRNQRPQGPSTGSSRRAPVFTATR